jgi:hypothetical protein
VKQAGFKCLHTGTLNQDPLEKKLEAICSYCGLNNNPTMVQYVDASPVALLLEVWVKLTVMMMVLLFWIL